MTFGRISILGLGLIGGSIALALRNRAIRCEISAYDVNGKSLQSALAGGVIDRAEEDAVDAVRGADCVLLALPPQACEMILPSLAPHFEQGACLSDVASVKAPIVRVAEATLPAGVHFVGAHPMAGRELSGFAAARADLFDRAVCIMTPTRQTDPAALSAVESLWHALGSRTVRYSPEEHDQLVAQISHLPHLVAAALMRIASPAALKVAGSGFRDVTRIAAGDAQLWREILRANRSAVADALRLLREELNQFEAVLNDDESDRLKDWLAAAVDKRRVAQSER
jgi:prephenate dehydrogenase